MRALEHDGTQHHGIGIKPSIIVKPTIAGIRAGKDEILARAIIEANAMR